MKSITEANCGQQRISRKRLCHLKPSPENQRLYREVRNDDPEIIELADSIRRHGILTPLVITKDRYIISGHRRYAAAALSGAITAPCEVLNFRRSDDIDRFVRLLREHNRQRDKTCDEQLREELLTVDVEEAYATLIEARKPAVTYIDSVRIEGTKIRHGISDAKADHVAHINTVIFELLREYWPITVRTVHYKLLNYDFQRNTDKGLQYVNDALSYKATSDLCTRLRFNGEIPWESLTDETRPVTRWQVYSNPRQFFRKQLDGFLTGYWRDLMQSQPDHIEVVSEKNTAYRTCCNVTGRYCIPTLSGRGFASVDPWHEMAQRFRASGKRQLIVILATDLDPEGEEIVQVAGRTMKEFDIRPQIIKVAVTPEQVERFELPQNCDVKTTGGRARKFIERHGHHVYELEALDPGVLQQELAQAIDSVIDTEMFNQELHQEKLDSAILSAARKTAVDVLQTMDFGECTH